MIKVGICGFGGLGHVHANTLCEQKDVELVAVCDMRPGQLAAKEVKTNLETGKTTFDISTARTYLRFEEMLQSESLDAVVTALPSDIHAEFAIMALEAGLHVFSEKPMALNSDECSRMIAARDRSGRQLMIGQCLRFWAEYDFLLDSIRKARYGKLLSLCMERIGGYSMWSADDWMNQARRSGGAILDLHLHDVDWVNYGLGQPSGLYAQGKIGKTGGIDDVTAIWDYTDGPVVTMRSSWMYAGFRMNFRAFFEDGILEYGFAPAPELQLIRPGQPKPELIAVDKRSAYANEMRYFLDCATGTKVNTICPAESTQVSVKYIELERESVHLGQRLLPLLS